MEIFVLITQLHNQTPWRFEFNVDKGICPLRDLPPGGSQSVKLSKILDRCRKFGSADWPIRVLVNNEFTGMFIYPHNLLWCTRIVFKYEQNTHGTYVLSAQGIREKGVDYALRHKGIGYILGRNKTWNKRPLVEIAQADSRWTRNLRSGFEDTHLVAPPVLRDNNTSPPRNTNTAATSLSQQESIRRQSNGVGTAAATSPPQHQRVRRRRNGGGVGRAAATSTSLSNSGGSLTVAEDRDYKRFNRVMALEKHDRWIRILLLVLAFGLVIFMRFFW